MKRPVEEQLMFPLLSVTYDPLSPTPVVVEMQMDWGLTGEVQIRYTTLQSLKDMNNVLQFLQNAVADEIGEPTAREITRKMDNENTPPF